MSIDENKAKKLHEEVLALSKGVKPKVIPKVEKPKDLSFLNRYTPPKPKAKVLPTGMYVPPIKDDSELMDLKKRVEELENEEDPELDADEIIDLIKGKLDVSNLKNGENVAIAVSKASSGGYNMNDQRWHGGGKGDSGTSGAMGASGYSGTSGFSGGPGASGISGFSGTSGTSGMGISGFSGTSGTSGFSGNSTSGFSGTSGTSGFSGTSGTSGTSGFSGTSGTSGFSGASGTSGTSGFSGTSGTSGFSGTSGTSGFSGTSGTSGFSGKSGFSGTSGAGGATGTSGTSGTSGFSGTSGTSGFSGTSGTSGFSGTSGTSGFSGKSGFSGTSGTSGFSGANPGTSGFSGTSGTSGFSGTSGTSGFSGTSGTSGFSGTSGTSGFSGAAGGGGEWTYLSKVTWSNEAGAKSFTSLAAHDYWMIIYTGVTTTHVSAQNFTMTLNSLGGTGYNYYYMRSTTLVAVNNAALWFLTVEQGTTNIGAYSGQYVIMGKPQNSSKTIFGESAADWATSNTLLKGYLASDNNAISTIAINSSESMTGTVELYYKDIN